MARIDTTVRPFSGKDELGYVSGENVVQTAEAVKGIYYLCNALPAICYALILVGIGLIFNLDKKTDQMYAEMAAKWNAAQG